MYPRRRLTEVTLFGARSRSSRLHSDESGELFWGTRKKSPSPALGQHGTRPDVASSQAMTDTGPLLDSWLNPLGLLFGTSKLFVKTGNHIVHEIFEARGGNSDEGAFDVVPCS